MWREYPGAGKELSVLSGGGEGSFVSIFSPSAYLTRSSPTTFLVLYDLRADHSLMPILIVVNRLFNNWLNNEILEFGGRLVDPLPTRYVMPLSIRLIFSPLPD